MIVKHSPKFKLSDEDNKKPDTVLKAFCNSLGTEISHQNAHTTLYNSFHQQKSETATELDIKLSRLIDECHFPIHDDIAKFLKWEVFNNPINYYEVMKWAPTV